MIFLHPSHSQKHSCVDGGSHEHSATYPDAWTDVTKVHLSSESHKDSPHTPMTFKNVNFEDLEYLEGLFTNHAVTLEKQVA